MKKNIAMRLASLVLMCTIITSCFVSSTFAKYTSSATGSGTASVAKWSFKVNNGEIATTDGTPANVDFSLFNGTAVRDLDGSENVINSNDAEVSASKIAPGTGGMFSYTVQNLSEVTATYSVILTITNLNGVPIEVSSDNSTWNPVVAGTPITIASGPAPTDETTVTCYWRWAFKADGSRDVADTAIGMSHPDVTATLSITATQEN